MFALAPRLLGREAIPQLLSDRPLLREVVSSGSEHCARLVLAAGGVELVARLNEPAALFVEGDEQLIRKPGAHLPVGGYIRHPGGSQPGGYFVPLVHRLLR